MGMSCEIVLHILKSKQIWSVRNGEMTNFWNFSLSILASTDYLHQCRYLTKRTCMWPLSLCLHQAWNTVMECEVLEYFQCYWYDAVFRMIYLDFYCFLLLLFHNKKLGRNQFPWIWKKDFFLIHILYDVAKFEIRAQPKTSDVPYHNHNIVCCVPNQMNQTMLF